MAQIATKTFLQLLALKSVSQDWITSKSGWLKST